MKATLPLPNFVESHSVVSQMNYRNRRTVTDFLSSTFSHLGPGVS